MTEKEVVELMKSSKSEEEWNNNCDIVKSRFGGDYPSFGFPMIVLSGVAGVTTEQFGKSDKITIHPGL